MHLCNQPTFNSMVYREKINYWWQIILVSVYPLYRLLFRSSQQYYCLQATWVKNMVRVHNVETNQCHTLQASYNRPRCLCTPYNWLTCELVKYIWSSATRTYYIQWAIHCHGPVTPHTDYTLTTYSTVQWPTFTLQIRNILSMKAT